MKSRSVRGTPVNHVGPTGALVGNREGWTPSVPKGYSGKTVADQYRGDGVGIDTRPLPGSGTPYNDADGNPDEASRVVSSDRYGVVLSENGQDHSNPRANGSGTIFDGATRENGMVATPRPYPDSPVPKSAPYFDTRTVAQEDRAHLGMGNASGADDLISGGGVMSR